MVVLRTAVNEGVIMRMKERKGKRDIFSVMPILSFFEGSLVSGGETRSLSWWTHFVPAGKYVMRAKRTVQIKNIRLRF